MTSPAAKVNCIAVPARVPSQAAPRVISCVIAFASATSAGFGARAAAMKS